MTGDVRTPRGLVTLLALAVALASLTVPAAAAAERRDQELVGGHYSEPLSRLSLFGAMGFGSVRDGGSTLPSSGRLMFDIGLLWDLHQPIRLGLSFNHFTFKHENPETGLAIPRDISDITGFVRFDGRDGRVTPFLQFGGGVYFSDNGQRSDVLRAAVGMEVPVSRALLHVEGRYTSYAAGAFFDPAGRQKTLGVVLGARFPFAFGGGGRRVDHGDLAERTRRTIRYVARPEEIEEVDGLETDEELWEYVEEFWRRRDPFPEVEGNPQRERHGDLVALAESRFGEMGTPGWASERGRTIIVNGQPDEVIWEEHIPRPGARDPFAASLAADTGSASALELWIYYRPVPNTDGRNSFFLFEEDAVSRFNMIWTNVRGEPGYGRALPPLPLTIAGPIRAGS